MKELNELMHIRMIDSVLNQLSEEDNSLMYDGEHIIDYLDEDDVCLFSHDTDNEIIHLWMGMLSRFKSNDIEYIKMCIIRKLNLPDGYHFNEALSTI